MEYPFAPNTIVQYWHEAVVPTLLQARMNQWRTTNPGCRCLVFNRASAAAALAALYGESFRQAFLAIKLPAMQADVFRVAYLHACGGIWIDAATHCLAPLHEWLDLGAQLVLLRKPGMIPPLVSNGFIYVSVSQHPFLGEALKRIADVITNRRGDGVWKLVGAGMFRDVLRDKSFARSVTVIDYSSVCSFIQYGSSSEALGHGSHWSVRQKREGLYLD